MRTTDKIFFAVGLFFVFKLFPKKDEGNSTYTTRRFIRTLQKNKVDRHELEIIRFELGG